MALRTSSAGFNKTLVLAFGMMGGLVALALGYSVMSKNANTDIRSKAAEETTIYNQWEFNGDTTENWVTNKPYAASVKKGKLELSVVKANSAAMIKNTSVATEIPKGNKYFVMSLSIGKIREPVQQVPASCPAPPTCAGQQRYVDTEHPLRGGCPSYKCIPIAPQAQPGQGSEGFGSWVRGAQDEYIDEEQLMVNSFRQGVSCASDVRSCPDGSVTGRSGTRCGFVSCPEPGTKFTGKIFYSLKKQPNKPAEMARPLDFSGSAFGKQTEVKVIFPEVGKVNLKTIRIQFTSGVKPDDVISIDWIRLLGARVNSTPTVTPTVTPKVTCVPRPSCMDPVDGGPVCKIVLAQGAEFCPKATATPSPVARATDSCTNARNGAACTISADCPVTASRAGCTKAGTCQNGTCVIRAATPATTGGCVRAGCSSELCIDAERAKTMGVSTCVYHPQYACYRTANCERQSTGACGFTKTAELDSCLSGAGDR